MLKWNTVYFIYITYYFFVYLSVESTLDLFNFIFLRKSSKKSVKKCLIIDHLMNILTTQSILKSSLFEGSLKKLYSLFKITDVELK